MFGMAFKGFKLRVNARGGGHAVRVIDTDSKGSLRTRELSFGKYI